MQSDTTGFAFQNTTMSDLQLFLLSRAGLDRPVLNRTGLDGAFDFKLAMLNVADLRPSLLAIDEVGYLAYDAHAADLLVQVVSRRYEQKSIVITTNLPFKQWDTVFPNAACAVALIDRLTHHAEIISIDGESYRKREAEQAQKRKQEQKPKR
jgi:hypothetical protein